MTDTGTWHEDVLGPDFEARTLALPDGAEATLVRHAPSVGYPPARVAVLYVHGFVDYFFHRHVAEAFAGRGYAFYALDLRGHGRSLAAHLAAGGDPNLVDDLALYARDLDAATVQVRAAGHAKLVVLGHSTGGLVASLWVAAQAGRADALVLNSPYLEVNRNWFVRGPVSRLIEILAGLAPRAVVGGLMPYYGRALHISTGGEWDFTLAWKPSESFPARAGWVRSVRRSQRRVARGLGLQLPVLVLTSDRSGPHGRWHADLVTTDSVLNVQHIRERARHIGDDVTLVEVPGGAHDLALSRSPGREKYLSSVLDWLDDRLASTENPPPPR